VAKFIKIYNEKNKGKLKSEKIKKYTQSKLED